MWIYPQLVPLLVKKNADENVAGTAVTDGTALTGLDKLTFEIFKCSNT